jgi:hypothetical protein
MQTPKAVSITGIFCGIKRKNPQVRQAASIPVSRNPGLGGRELPEGPISFFGRKDDFFRTLRYGTARYLHETWHDLFLAVYGNAPDG